MFPVLDLIGVLLAIPGLSVLAYHLYLRLCGKWNDYQDYPASLENARIAVTNLRHEYNGLLYELRGCDESVKHSGSHIRSLPLCSLPRTYDFIQGTLLRLANTDSEDLSRNAISRFLHSESINRECHQLEELANALIDRLQRMRVYCPLILFNEYHIVTARKFVEDLRATGFSCENMIQIYQRRAGALSPCGTELAQPTMFQFKSQVYTVKNPPYITLDFNGDTPEGRLKNCILRSEDESQDVFTCRKIVLEGREGCGKTCIMRGLATCDGIQQKFLGRGKGGIYSIAVGQNCDSSDIKRQLSEIVNISGGWHLRERILSEPLPAGVLMCASWFLHKDTLFLVDENDSAPFAAGAEALLETLCKTSSGSAAVFSRRARAAGGTHGARVRVPSGDEFAAEAWLQAVVQPSRRRMDGATAAALARVVAAWRRSRRLLGVAGACYGLLRRGRGGAAAWETLARRLRAGRGAEHALIAVFLELAKPGDARQGHRAGRGVYRAFRVVLDGRWVPLRELPAKCGLAVDESVSVQRLLVQGRVCQITERVVGETRVRGIEADAFWAEAMRRACLCEQAVAAA